MRARTLSASAGQAAMTAGQVGVHLCMCRRRRILDVHWKEEGSWRGVPHFLKHSGMFWDEF